MAFGRFTSKREALNLHNYIRFALERFGRTINKEKKLFNVESWLVHHGYKLEDRFLLQAYKAMNHLLATVDITRKGDSLEKIINNISSNIHLIA